MGSGWFDTTEPPLSTYLEEKQGIPQPRGARMNGLGVMPGVTWALPNTALSNIPVNV